MSQQFNSTHLVPCFIGPREIQASCGPRSCGCHETLASWHQVIELLAAPRWPGHQAARGELVLSSHRPPWPLGLIGCLGLAGTKLQGGPWFLGTHGAEPPQASWSRCVPAAEVLLLSGYQVADGPQITWFMKEQGSMIPMLSRDQATSTNKAPGDRGTKGSRRGISHKNQGSLFHEDPSLLGTNGPAATWDQVAQVIKMSRHPGGQGFKASWTTRRRGFLVSMAPWGHWEQAIKGTHAFHGHGRTWSHGDWLSLVAVAT